MYIMQISVSPQTSGTLRSRITSNLRKHNRETAKPDPYRRISYYPLQTGLQYAPTQHLSSHDRRRSVCCPFTAVPFPVSRLSYFNNYLARDCWIVPAELLDGINDGPVKRPFWNREQLEITR